MLGPVIWKDNRPMTPQQVQRDREMAQAAYDQATGNDRIGHWTQGAAKMAQALVGRLREGRAQRGEDAGYAEADAEMARRFPELYGSAGSSSPVAAALAGDGASFASPSGDASSIRDGLIARGLPDHVADGFVMNFQDESGLNPGINEASPLVPGSRGGFGLAQWTGPRRVALEKFAADRGVAPSDVNAQLDFLVQELQGPEAAAAQSIFGAQNAGEAGAAIVNNFLRPAEEHRNRRAQAYLGGGGGGVPAALAAGPSSADITAAMANPWVAQKYGPVLQALAGQAGQREQAIFAQQLAQSDPMYQAQLAQLTAPKPVDPFAGTQVINGQLVRMGDAGPEVVGDYRDQGNAGFDPDRYRVVGNTLFDLAAEGGPSPVGDGTGTEEVIFGPDGTPIMVRGSAGAAKSFTEAQSKDVGFATRMRGAEEQLAPVETALTNIGDRVLGADPTGIARGAFQSEDYQKARQSGQTWLLAFLRKDSGAATTKEEDRMYGETFLPQPGDGPAVIEQKRMGRDLAMRAVEAGMSPQQALAQVRALGGAQSGDGQSAQPQQPATGDGGWTDTGNGIRIRRRE